MCWEVVWMVKQGCLEGVVGSVECVRRLLGGYGNTVWWVCAGCLVDMWKPSRVCGEAIWRVWGGYLEGVGRLSGGHGKAIWRVWGGCLEGVGRLSGGCGEAVCRVM